MIEVEIDDNYTEPTETVPENLRTRVRAASNTVRAMRNDAIHVADDDVIDTEAINAVLFREAASPDPEYLPTTAEDKLLSRANNAIYLQKLLTAYDIAIIEDAAALRRYVRNRLVVESNHKLPSHRLKALELLGKMSDVSLFTEKQEITINHKSTENLNQILEDKLFRLMHTEPSPIIPEEQQKRMSNTPEYREIVESSNDLISDAQEIPQKEQ